VSDEGQPPQSAAAKVQGSALNIPRTSGPDGVASMLHGILGNEWEGEEICGTSEYAVARRETAKSPPVAGLLG
jgi:hypothetical protein